jgi:hypothetical protein
MMLMFPKPLLHATATVILATLSSCFHTPPNPPSNPAKNTPLPKPATCDCSTFPPKSGCDSECGIATGVVESVQGNSVTLQVPSITTDAAGKQIATMSRRTFQIGGAEAQQLRTIAPGSRVAITFKQGNGEDAVRSLRRLPAAHAP